MSVVVNIIRNPFEPELREQSVVEHAPGKKLDYYMPNICLDRGKSLSVAINGREIKDDPATVPVYDGDKIAVAIRTDGGVATAVASWVVAATTSISSIAMSGAGFGALVGTGMYGAAAIYGATYLATFAAIGFGVSTLVSALSPDTPSFRGGAGETLESPTYGWDVLQQTETEGNPIPVLFGKQKIAGQVLNQFKTIEEDGKEYLHMLLGICDHAVDNIYDIRVNDQPAEYYKDVTVYTRLGTLDDTVIPGFAQQVLQKNVGVQFVEQNTAHTQQTDGNSVEELRIILAANRGMYYSNDEGGLDERYADFEILYRAVGAANWTTYKSAYRISGATTEAIRREIRIAGLPPDQYEVRITRLSAETPSHREETRIVWQQLLEIVDEALIYPGLAKYAITALATDQLSGAAPTVSCIAERNTVSIYNPNTSLWESRSADNPAWACYALLNTHHGIHSSRMLYDEFSEWAAWCAEMVDGGQRCTVNAYLDTQGNAWNQAQSIARLGRGTIVRRGTKYGVFVDKPEDVVSHLFTPGNIIEGTFNLEYLSQKDRANAVEIAYNDPDRDYTNQVVAVYSDDFKNSDTPANKTNIKYNAAIPRAQAIREAAFLLNSNKYLVRTVEFEAAVDSFACTVGDMVYFQHVIPDYGSGLGGRIVDAGNDDGSGNPYVQLDQEVELIAGTNYSVLVRLSNDDLVEKQLQSVATTHTTDLLLLTSNWDAVPSEYDVYAFGPAATYKKQYRITNITRAQDLTRRITCLEYIPEIYEDTSYIIETPTWGDAVSQEAVQVSAREFLSYGKGGDYQSNIAVSWNPANSNVGSNWVVWLEDQTLTRQWISDEGGEFEAGAFETTEESTGITKIGETSENRIRIGPSYLTQFHEYKIYVGPVDGGMQDTGENTTTIQIFGKLAPPNDVYGFAGTWNSMKRTVNFAWQEVDNIDVSHYEIRQGTVWDIGTVVVKEAKKGSASIAIEEGVSETRTYLIKAVDTSGIYSVNYASTDVAIDTAQSPLQVPTGLSLSTESGIASDGTDRVTILAQWDNNAEVADEFRHYELILERISTGKKAAYVTPETEYQWEVLPNTAYGVILRAVDMTGNKTAWTAQQTIISAKDSTPPATPSSVVATGFFSSILLEWSHGAEIDLSNFDVYRNTSNDSSTATKIGSTTRDGIGTNATYKDEPGNYNTYYYWVKAVDTSGNASGFSSVVSASKVKIDTVDIGSEVITTTELAGLSVGEAQLADTAVTTAKLANNAVDTSKLADLAVEAAKLADSSVESTKIANAAVGSAAIANLAVGTAHIADTAITNAKIEKWIMGKSGTSFPASPDDGEIVYRTDENKVYRYDAANTAWINVDFVTDSGRIANGVITSTHIIDAAITNAKIRDAAVTNAKIGNLAVSSAQIKDAAIVNAKIADLAVDTIKIADNAVVAGKISVSTLSAISADIGKVTAGVIESHDWGTATGMQIDLDNELVRLGGLSNPKLAWDGVNLILDGSGLIAGTVNANAIEAGTVTADKFESTFYGNLNQAINVTQQSLAAGAEYEKTITQTDLNNATVTNIDIGPHPDHAESIRLFTQRRWDGAGETWDTGYWDIPVEPSGTFEMWVDSGSEQTVQLALDYFLARDNNTSITVEAIYSLDNASWGSNDPGLNDGIWETLDINEISANSYRATGSIYTLRYYRLRITLSTTDTNNNIIVYNMIVRGSIVYAYAAKMNETIAAGGTTFGITGFKKAPAVTVTPISGGPLVPVVTAASATQFTVKLFNLSGADVGGTANIIYMGV